jgi:hypothetical protein
MRYATLSAQTTILTQLKRMEKILTRLSEFSDPELRALFGSLADQIREIQDHLRVLEEVRRKPD